MPPCFGSAASATSEAASKHKTAASARTLRMFLSLESSASLGLLLPRLPMTARARNEQGGGRHWPFGLLQNDASHQAVADTADMRLQPCWRRRDLTPHVVP